jgi:hypothetical protein
MTPWTPLEPDLETILRRFPRPLDALASAEVPALVLRGAYPPAQCGRLVARLNERGLLYDPAGPVPKRFLDEAIPEGFYREGITGKEVRAWRESSADASIDAAKRRIDIGTSLGYRGSDRDAFFAHAAETHRLFATLFDGLADPIAVIYERLGALAPGKRVLTAREPDGRLYGPAIFRAHYGAYTYKPHFDSVRLREKRADYAVHRFEHQFAGVLVLQNAVRGGDSAQCTIHRYLWEPDVQPHLDAGTFAEFATARGIEGCRVELEPGDLYFFNTRAIHEVPGIDGELPRVVLATFIGYSSDDGEVFVWS